MPCVAKKRLLRKKLKRHYLCSNQKLASTQTIGSAFLERVRKKQKSNYALDLLKLIDCFIDGYGFEKSDRVNFLMKIFDNPIIFSHMLTKLLKISKKKKKTHRCQKICK